MILTFVIGFVFGFCFFAIISLAEKEGPGNHGPARYRLGVNSGKNIPHCKEDNKHGIQNKDQDHRQIQSAKESPAP